LICKRSWQLRAQAEESEAQNLFIYFILLLLHSFCLLIYQRSWQLRAQAEESEAQNLFILLYFITSSFILFIDLSTVLAAASAGRGE
jgi:hypothetical protein